MLFRSVESGIEPGTLVVVDGADKLREGAVVEMVVRDSSPPKEGGARKGRGNFEKMSEEDKQKSREKRRQKSE